MDNVPTPTPRNYEFAKEVGKTLAISTATSTGVLTGLLLAGYAYKKYEESRKRRSTVFTTPDIPAS